MEHSSVNKRCPFKDLICSRDCALFDKGTIEGCTFIEISMNLSAIGNNTWDILKQNEKIITMLAHKTEEDE